MTCSNCMKTIKANEGEPWYTLGQDKRTYCTSCWTNIDQPWYKKDREVMEVRVIESLRDISCDS